MRYHGNGAGRFFAVGVILAALACGSDARAEGSDSKPAQSARQRAGTKHSARLGVLRVKVDVPGAAVLLDGKLVGRAPIEEPVRVSPGRHVIQALGAEAEDTRHIDVTAGRPSDIELKVAPKDDEAAPQPSLPLAPISEPPPMPPPALESDEEPRGIVEAGVAATLLVSLFALGTGAAAAAKEAASEARRDEACRSCPGAYNDMQRDAALLSNTSLWSFVAAGAIATGTALYAMSVDGPGGKGSKTGIVIRGGTVGFETNF
ncbi:hypothetical protein [Polyangium aurulentum]|uniref:hypothetical protein n=1 Tax=Polyangium aurulentum TaxID=2567896 RepID=UPI0010AE2DFB|nr:hypothetical protein [Polyangium aurulentum]UQA57584.1 hypothetical protein E8A73_040945 [Polyangium aurulentum]